MTETQIHHHKGAQRRKLPPLSELAPRVQAGESIAQLAADLGCGESTLRQKFRTSGLSPDTGFPYVPKAIDPRPALASFEYRGDEVPGQGDCYGKDPADWFPEDHKNRHARRAAEERAKAVCAGCPQQTRCLAYAVRINEQFGIFGGLTADERRALTDGSAA